MMKGDLGQSDANVEHLCWGIGNDDDGPAVRDSMLGRVIGGNDDYSRDGDDAEEGQEPLALLTVHAAMHMLFLPQFTCEFFEENNEQDLDASFDDEDDSLDSERSEKKRGKKENLTEEEREAQRLLEQEEEEADLFMKKEAGLKETKYAESGILLSPRPTTIVWAGGIGLKPNKVSEYDKISSHAISIKVKDPV